MTPTMKMHCGFERHVIPHQDLDIIPLVHIKRWPRQLTIRENHFSFVPIRGSVLPGEGHLEGSNFGLRENYYIPDGEG